MRSAKRRLARRPPDRLRGWPAFEARWRIESRRRLAVDAANCAATRVSAVTGRPAGWRPCAAARRGLAIPERWRQVVEKPARSLGWISGRLRLESRVNVRWTYRQVGEPAGRRTLFRPAAGQEAQLVSAPRSAAGDRGLPSRCLGALFPPPPGRGFQGAMPFSASSFKAASVFFRCPSPMPRRTWSALVNWIFS